MLLGVKYQQISDYPGIESPQQVAAIADQRPVLVTTGNIQEVVEVEPVISYFPIREYSGINTQVFIPSQQDTLIIEQQHLNKKLDSILQRLIAVDPELQKLNQEKAFEIKLFDCANPSAFIQVGTTKDKHTIYISKGLLSASLVNFSIEDQGVDAITDIVCHELAHPLAYILAYSKVEQSYKDLSTLILGIDPFSHFEENFCDQYAVKLMDKAGFNPKYAGFQIFGDDLLNDSYDSGLLGSHPKLARRHQRVQRIVKNSYLSSYSESPSEKFTKEEIFEITSPSKFQAILTSKEARNSGPYSKSSEAIFLNILTKTQTCSKHFDDDFNLIRDYFNQKNQEEMAIAKEAYSSLVQKSFANNESISKESKAIIFALFGDFWSYVNYEKELKNLENLELDSLKDPLASLSELMEVMPNVKLLHEAGFKDSDMLKDFDYVVKNYVEKISNICSIDSNNIEACTEALNLIENKLLEKNNKGSVLRLSGTYCSDINLQLKIEYDENFYKVFEDLLSNDQEQACSLIKNLADDDIVKIFRASSKFRKFMLVGEFSLPVDSNERLKQSLCNVISLDELINLASTKEMVAPLFFWVLNAKIREQEKNLNNVQVDQIKKVILVQHENAGKDFFLYHTFNFDGCYDLSVTEYISDTYLRLINNSLETLESQEFIDYINSRISHSFYCNIEDDVLKKKLESLVAKADNKAIVNFFKRTKTVEINGRLHSFIDTGFTNLLIQRYLSNLGLQTRNNDVAIVHYGHLNQHVCRYQIPTKARKSPLLRDAKEIIAKALSNEKDFQLFTRTRSHDSDIYSNIELLCEQDYRFLFEHAKPDLVIVVLDALIDKLDAEGKLDSSKLKEISSYFQDSWKPIPLRYSGQGIDEYFGSAITLYDFCFMRFFAKKRTKFLREMPYQEAIKWFNDNFNRATPYRNVILARVFERQFDSIDCFEDQVKILKLFTHSAKAYELKTKFFYKNLENKKGLKNQLKFLTELFSERNPQRDELIDEILSQNSCSFTEFQIIVKPLLSSSSYTTDKARSFIDGSVKTLFNNNLVIEDKNDIFLWFANLGKEPMLRLSLITDKTGIDFTKTKELFIANKQFRDEMLEELMLSSNDGLFGHSSFYTNSFVDSLFSDHFDLNTFKEEEKRIVTFMQQALKAILSISNETKKLQVLKALFDLFIDKAKEKEQVKIEDLIKVVVSGYGVIGDKFLQNLGSQLGIKKRYPELYNSIQKIKSGKRKFSTCLAFEAIEKNKKLSDNYEVVLHPQISSASLKSVFPCDLVNKQDMRKENLVLKIKRPDVDKFMIEEKDTFAELMDLLAPIVQDIFGISKMPNFSARIFSALEEELDFENEMNYSERLSQIVDDFNRDNKSKYSVKTPKQRRDLSTSYMIPEKRATGLTFDDWFENAPKQDLEAVNETLLDMFLHMLNSNFFHADPHGGNIIIDENTGEINLIDAGTCGKINPGLMKSVNKELNLKLIMKFIFNQKVTVLERLKLFSNFSKSKRDRLIAFIADKISVEKKYVENIINKINPQAKDPLALIILNELEKIPGFKVPKDLDKFLLCLSKPILKS